MAVRVRRVAVVEGGGRLPPALPSASRHRLAALDQPEGHPTTLVLAIFAEAGPGLGMGRLGADVLPAIAVPVVALDDVQELGLGDVARPHPAAPVRRLE